ncbi:MAG: DUF1565 domain-containing protein [Anaerolineae bacterium]|nr:DUF1565 domain-containing protein [Anaerolineae bacterium]
MRKPSLLPIVALLALVAAALACSLPVGGPSRPGAEIPVSEAAADRAEHAVRTALEAAAQTRSFTITLSQAEVTSWVVLRAGEYALQVGEKVPLDNLQIYLDDGVIRLYGDYDDRGVAAQALVTVRPSVTPAGLVDAQITAAQVGPVTLGDADLQSLNAAVQDALRALNDRLAGSYRVIGLLIDDGSAVLSGAVTGD